MIERYEWIASVHDKLNELWCLHLAKFWHKELSQRLQIVAQKAFIGGELAEQPIILNTEHNRLKYR